MSRGRPNRSPAALRSAHLPVTEPPQASNETSQQIVNPGISGHGLNRGSPPVPQPADMADVQTVRNAPLAHVTETGNLTFQDPPPVVGGERTNTPVILTRSHGMQASAAPQSDQMSKERTNRRGRRSASPSGTTGATTPSRPTTASPTPVFQTAFVATRSSSRVTPSRVSDAASPEPGAFPRATGRASRYTSGQVVWRCVSLIFSLVPRLLQDGSQLTRIVLVSMRARSLGSHGTPMFDLSALLL